MKMLMQGEEGTPKALKTDVISRLMSLIGHQNPSVPSLAVQIQYNVSMTLANISFNEEGKASIIAKGCIK
jgi:hypothetical protein